MPTMDSKGGIKLALMCLTFAAIMSLCAGGDYHHSEKILLTDVKALTLRKGKMTNARRSSAVPQLKCVGGSAKYKFNPEVVQCINMGSDGYDIQWECKTDMDNSYRFGNVEVTCEGYDYPNDPYVLKGSCGLEYTVEFTEEGWQREKKKGGSSYHYNNDIETSSEGGVGGLFVFIGVLFAIFVIYKTCIAPNVEGQQSQTQPPPYGFRPEYTQPPTGPPPPYNSWDQPDPSCAGNDPFTSRSSPRYSHNSRESNTGGFWSGAATGGILGYMFGSRNSNNYASPGYRSSTPPSGGFFSSSRNSSSSSDRSTSSGTRTASGFGGTSRR